MARLQVVAVPLVPGPEGRVVQAQRVGNRIGGHEAPSVVAVVHPVERGVEVGLVVGTLLDLQQRTFMNE